MHRTALHLAASHGFAPVVKILLSRGADIEVKDKVRSRIYNI